MCPHADIQLFDIKTPTPVGAGLHGQASASGALQAGVDFHRGVDLTTSLDLVGKVGSETAGLVRAALSAGGSVRGAGEFQVGLPLDLFSAKGGGLLALLRVQLEAAGFVEATVEVDAQFAEKLLGSMPGPLAGLIDIFLDELVINAGVWAHAGVCAQLVAEVKLTGSLLPVDEAGFTFSAQFAAGWYFGYGLNYLTNFTFKDTRRMLGRLSAATSDLLLGEVDELIGGLPTADAKVAREALPYLRVLMPVASRGLFELAAQLVKTAPDKQQAEAARSIVQSIFSQAQQSALHAVFDLALGQLSALVADAGVLDRLLGLDTTERNDALSDLDALRDGVAALDQLHVAQSTDWVAAVMVCLAPLERLLDKVLPSDARQVVGTIWAVATLLERCVPWVAGDGTRPDPLNSSDHVDPTSSPATASWLAETLPLPLPPDQMPFSALIDFLVVGDPMTELHAAVPPVAQALEWVGRLTGAAPGEIFKHILGGFGDLSDAAIGDLVSTIGSAAATELEQRVLPHLIDPLIEGAQAELRPFLEQVVRPTLVALPKVILPRLADLGTKEAGSRLAEAISGVLLQNTSHFVLPSLDLLMDHWLTQGADDIEITADKIADLGRESPVFSAVAGVGAAMVVGIDVQPGDVRDLLNICAHAMRRWNDTQRHAILEATRVSLDLGLRAGGTAELDEILTTDNPPNGDQLKEALVQVAEGAFLMLTDPKMIEFALLLPIRHALYQGEQLIAVVEVAVQEAVRVVGDALKEIAKWEDRLAQLTQDIPKLAEAAAAEVAALAHRLRNLEGDIVTKVHHDAHRILEDVTAAMQPFVRDAAETVFEVGFDAVRAELDAPLQVLEEVAGWVADILTAQLHQGNVGVDALHDNIRNAIYQLPNPTLTIPIRLPLPPPFNIFVGTVSVPGPGILGTIANVILGDAASNAHMATAVAKKADQAAAERERDTLQKARAAGYTAAQAEAARKAVSTHPAAVVTLTMPLDHPAHRGPTIVTVRAEGVDAGYVNHAVLDIPERVRITVNDQQLPTNGRWHRDGTAMTYSFEVLPPINDDPPPPRTGWAEQAWQDPNPLSDPFRRRLAQVIGLAGVNTVTVSCVDATPRVAALSFSLALPQRADLLWYDIDNARGICLSCQEPHYAELTNPDPDRTWTSVLAGSFGPGPLSGLAFYSASTGRLQLCSMGLGGPLVPVGESKVGLGWTSVVSGDFDRDGNGDLLFYNPVTGKAELWASDGHGGEALLKGHDYFGAGWTVLTTGDFNRSGHDDLLFYNGANGQMELRTGSLDTGMIEVYRADLNIGPGWTHILPGDFGGTTGNDLFSYNETTSHVRLWEFDATGNVAPLCDPTKSDAAAPALMAAGDFAHQGADEVFLWSAQAMTGIFYLPRPDDPVALRGKPFPLGIPFTQILKGRFV